MIATWISICAGALGVFVMLLSVLLRCSVWRWLRRRGHMLPVWRFQGRLYPADYYEALRVEAQSASSREGMVVSGYWRRLVISDVLYVAAIALFLITAMVY